MGVIESAKSMSIEQNVCLRVIDQVSGKVVQEHVGHNCATNSILVGIAHYLVGDGVLNQGKDILGSYIPMYISLGTMGLYDQTEDENFLPTAIGLESLADDEAKCNYYMEHRPGYSADGYSNSYIKNNNRPYFGLGPTFDDRPDPDRSVECELISASFPRAAISQRQIIPEYEAEVTKTVDIVFSAMISTGALKQFRQDGCDYIFITEAGLWSSKQYQGSGENGLLAAYRLAPTDKDKWDMSDPDNRTALKSSILRVGMNQVVQVIWKIQLGSYDVFNTMYEYDDGNDILYPLEGGN